MRKPLYIFLLVVFLLAACKSEATTPVPPPAAGASNGAATDAPATAASAGGADAPTAANPPTQAAPANPSGCSDSGAFVADVTVPDYAQFEPGAAVHKVWRVRNTGACTWNGQYTLVFAKGSQMDAPDSIPLDVTAPGETLDIVADMTAPASDGNYRADFEIHAPGGAAIPIDTSTYLWVIITVGNAAAAGGDTGGGSSGGGGASGPGLASATCAYTSDPSKVSAVIAAINAYRAQNGEPPYTVNAELSEAAQAHSADMACNSLFYHNGSNGSSPWSRVAAIGFPALNVSENVYGSYPPLSGAEVVNWWATDQLDIRHNQNLLSAKYTLIGVGYAFFNNFGYYVMDFVTPAQDNQGAE